MNEVKRQALNDILLLQSISNDLLRRWGHAVPQSEDEKVEIMEIKKVIKLIDRLIACKKGREFLY